MKNTILQTIRKHNLIEKDMHIVMGLSGGPDSLCLFDVLCDLREELGIEIHPVHVNHKFRPGAAEEDQHFVEELCRQRGMQCRTFIYDCNALAQEKGIGSEAAGRLARYEAFDKVALEIEASQVPKNKIAIAVAQNANDQCETILFRILRGSGTDGLAGIAYKRFDENGFAIIRPLLDGKRENIEAYCESRHLNPRIDHTNNQALYTRNKIRLELIPFIKDRFNGNIVETVNRLGAAASADKEYMWQQASEAFRLCSPEKGIIITDKLAGVHKAIRLRVYNMALEQVGMRENVTQAYLEAIDRIRLSESPSAMTELADGFLVRKSYDRMIFGKRVLGDSVLQDSVLQDGILQNGILQDSVLQDSAHWKLSLMTACEYKYFAKKNILHGAFCADDLAEIKDICLRTRLEGDYIYVGLSGEHPGRYNRKKIQDFFVDAKIPKAARDSMLLLAYGHEILWILPSDEFKDAGLRKKGRFSAKHKIGSGNKENIIVLENLLDI